MDLVLFTLAFPYDTSEPFLEQEVPMLARHFDHVYIVPSSGHHLPIRNLPENAKVVNLKKGQKAKPSLTDLLPTLPLWLPVYLWSLFRPGCFSAYLKYYKSFIHYAWQDLQSYRKLKQFIENQSLRDALFYDYWFVNSMLTLSKLKRDRIIHKLICRTHGFDLYDERQYEKLVSYRDYKIKHTDHVYAISRQGRNYLMSRINQKYSSKILLSYLGVSYPENPHFNTYLEKKYLVVSCSSMIPLKRVDRIPVFLNKANLPIHWIHFGDGICNEKLSKALDKIQNSGNLTFELKGHVDNSELLNFYYQNKVDLFITLSESEGLPVSIMEAISFGIPVLATNVGGVPEIVTEKIGAVVSHLLDEKEIVNGIRHILLSQKYKATEIRTFFKENFWSTTNYEKFSKKIAET